MIKHEDEFEITADTTVVEFFANLYAKSSKAPEAMSAVVSIEVRADKIATFGVFLLGEEQVGELALQIMDTDKETKH